MNLSEQTNTQTITLKEQATNNIKDLHGTGIDFVLMDGTLLGAYRDKDFCEGDEDDIDIGILDKDYDIDSKLLTEKLEALGFERYKDLVYKDRVEGFGIRRGGNHIDVIRINKHPIREEFYNLGRTGDGTKIMAFVYPSYEGFGDIEFKGLKFKIPKDTEIFLEARYGNWKKKISRPNFDWCTQSNNDSIKEDYDIL